MAWADIPRVVITIRVRSIFMCGFPSCRGLKGAKGLKESKENKAVKSVTKPEGFISTLSHGGRAPFGTIIESEMDNPG
jgi:hypothetical protein